MCQADRLSFSVQGVEDSKTLETRMRSNLGGIWDSKSIQLWAHSGI